MQVPFLAPRAAVLSANRLSLTAPTITNRRQCLRRTAQLQATVRADSSFPSTLKLSKNSTRSKEPKSQGASSRAMLSGVRLSEDDLSKPQVGILSTWYEGNTCNMYSLKFSSEAVKRGVEEHGMVGVRVMTSMGMGEVGNSLNSMDFIETVMSAQWYDGYISITRRDKNMLGTVIAMGRLNRPSIMVFVGTSKCYGENVSEEISDEQRNDTGNIIASAVEVMGMCLPCSSSISAEDPSKSDECRLAGKYLHELLNMDVKPRDIITHKSLRNAMVVVKAVGGSDDDLPDLIAIARSVGLDLTSNDFQKVSDEVPFLADVLKLSLDPFKNNEHINANFLHTGGTPAVIRYLLDHKYLDGDCMTGTSNLILLHFFVYCNFQALIFNILNICCNGFSTLVTGKTLAENAESYPRLPDGQVGTGKFYPLWHFLLPYLSAFAKHSQIFQRNVADIEGNEPKGEPSMLEMWTRAFETVGAFFTQANLWGYAAKVAGNMIGALATAILTATPLKRGTLSALMVRIPVVDLAVKILGIILENSPSHFAVKLAAKLAAKLLAKSVLNHITNLVTKNVTNFATPVAINPVIMELKLMIMPLSPVVAVLLVIPKISGSAIGIHSEIGCHTSNPVEHTDTVASGGSHASHSSESNESIGVFSAVDPDTEQQTVGADHRNSSSTDVLGDASESSAARLSATLEQSVDNDTDAVEQGFNNPLKQVRVLKRMAKFDVEILCLMET
ncbi:hypothetical protein GQ457_13G029060 [Hibiscus cannabinus]